MKILCVIDHFGSGGAQRQMVALATGLKGRGHDITCLSYFPQFDFFRPQLDAAGIAVLSIGKRGRLGVNVLLGLRSLLRKHRYDVVVAFMETPSIYVELAALGLPVAVIASERVDPEEGRLTPYLWARSMFHRAANIVVANSATSRDCWARMCPGLGPRFRVIRNGVDLSHFVPGPAPGVERGIRLVGMGTVIARKNLHGLVAALAQLRAKGDPLPHVTWVGKDEPGPDGAAYRATVEALLREHDLESQWLWAGEQKDVRPFLANAHALIHPSFREGLANVICEALAMARPVLASAIGDNHWLLGREERGMMFEPTDAGAIADAVQRFSRLSASERLALGSAARSFAEGELGFERYVGRYEELMSQIVSPRKAAAGGV